MTRHGARRRWDAAALVLAVGLATAVSCAPQRPERPPTSGYAVHEMPTRPYAFAANSIPQVVPLGDDVEGKQVDARGVLIVRLPGIDRRVYHPVALAMYGLYALEAYHLTADREYLRRAVANAEALLDHAERRVSGMWFLYDFDFRFNGDADMTIHAPWRSAMAQGQALSLFTRLAEETGEDSWAGAAAEVYRTFRSPAGAETTLWSSDDLGNGWLEEYIGDIPPTHVVNGHIYALFGLADYYRLRPADEVRRMIDAAATTIRVRFPSIRMPGGAAYYCVAAYCLQSDFRSRSYHRGVATQLRQLGQLTGDDAFADAATLLDEDAARFEARD